MSAATDNTSSQDSTLPREVLASIWGRVADRLQQGEVLVRNDQFLLAMEEEYRVLTGRDPQRAISNYLGQLIEVVNGQHPGTYVMMGLQNSVNKAFDNGVRALQWNEAKIQENGARSIKRFTQRESVRGLLDEMNVRPSQIDVLRVVQKSIESLRTSGGIGVVEVAEALSNNVAEWQRLGELSTDGVLTPAAMPSSANVVVDREVQAAIESGDLEAGQVQRRVRQEDQKAAQIQALEMEKVPERLDAFVERGTITGDEAKTIRQLHNVDERLKRGEIDIEEASRVRNSLMDGEARSGIESKVRETVEQSSRYIQVFEALRKINPKSDDGLEFLIRHKEGVTAVNAKEVALIAAVDELADDTPLLQKVIDLMERNDHELRMVSVRLPPYNLIMSRQLERINHMTIEVSFLDELRRLTADDISERLNSSVPETRVRPAADMRCLISLIDHPIKRTAFRKEIRMLRVAMTMEQFFRDTTDMQEARHMAENFLNLRMRRLFPDLSSEETNEIRQRGSSMIDAIEQKMLLERRQAVEEKRRETENATQKLGEEGNARDVDELSEEEKAKGVMIGRVEMRVAGGVRRVPRKIMPDPDDEDRFLLAKRDPETGEPVPEIRRNAKRYVERGRGGAWMISN
jgi:hypothetical protein